MATNRLAPSSVNALLETAARTRPEYQELARYLGPRAPSVEYKWLGEGNRGEFSYDPKPFGKISINSAYQNSQNKHEAAVPTLAHEMVHASDLQLRDLYSTHAKAPQTPEMRQFTDAYEKLLFKRKPYDVDGSFPRSIMAARIGGEKWLEGRAGYRASNIELPAQAIGNAMRSWKDSDTPAHLDPTLATEYRILLDLASRAQESLGKK